MCRGEVANGDDKGGEGGRGPRAGRRGGSGPILHFEEPTHMGLRGGDRVRGLVPGPAHLTWQVYSSCGTRPNPGTGPGGPDPSAVINEDKIT